LCDNVNGRLYLFGVKGNIWRAAVIVGELRSAAPHPPWIPAPV
jgi:hypothetical protein